MEEFRGQLEALSNKMGECQNQLSLMREKLAAEVFLNHVNNIRETFAKSIEASPDKSNRKDDSGISFDSTNRDDLNDSNVNSLIGNVEDKNGIAEDQGNIVRNSLFEDDACAADDGISTSDCKMGECSKKRSSRNRLEANFQLMKENATKSISNEDAIQEETSGKYPNESCNSCSSNDTIIHNNKVKATSFKSEVECVTIRPKFAGRRLQKNLS